MRTDLVGLRAVMPFIVRGDPGPSQTPGWRVLWGVPSGWPLPSIFVATAGSDRTLRHRLWRGRVPTPQRLPQRPGHAVPRVAQAVQGAQGGRHHAHAPGADGGEDAGQRLVVG